MKTVMTNEELISKITKDRLEMYERIKENLNNNSSNLTTNIDELLEAMHEEDKNAKEYIAILKAKDMIANLTKQIIEAKDVEEIMSIRKSVNYYINKIKNILKKRGITPNELDKLSENTYYMRKDIARYIRVLKRENNIEDINALNNNFGPLSIDDTKNLKKLIRNEINYTKRNQSNLGNDGSYVKKEEVKEEVIESNPTEQLSIDELLQQFMEEPDTKPSKQEELEKALRELSEKNNSTPKPKEKQSLEVALRELRKKDNSSVPQKRCVIFDETIEVKDYVDSFKNLSQQYGIKNLHIYNTSFSKNCIRLIRNIPNYIKNKKAIKIMQRDYNNYQRSQDFKLFIKYTREKNSITNAIGSIFKKSKLFRRETECSNIYREYSNWIEKYLSQGKKKIYAR